MNKYIHKTNRSSRSRKPWLEAMSLPLIAGVVANAGAVEPCGDFDECKVLVEINSTDGDIGFHWLVDAEDLRSIRIDDADGAKVYENKAYGPLADQTLTETFGESSEPVCREALKEEEDDVVVTLQDFVARWPSGPYDISGSAGDGEKLVGQTSLTYQLPAAPENVAYSGSGGALISWDPGHSLGECASEAELDALLSDVLPVHPEDVSVASWEVVLEVEDDSSAHFTVRLPYGQPTMVTVPSDFLDALPFNTPAKIEVGAIGHDDNASFTELGDLCLNETGDGCAEEDN